MREAGLEPANDTPSGLDITDFFISVGVFVGVFEEQCQLVIGFFIVYCCKVRIDSTHGSVITPPAEPHALELRNADRIAERRKAVAESMEADLRESVSLTNTVHNGIQCIKIRFDDRPGILLIC